MQEEEARRLVIEETYEFKKPKDKEEKRFLRVIAHFDSILFKEALLGEPVPEGEKSVTLPMKFKLQGEGMFAAFFFHIVAIATYLFLLLLAFYVKYDPESSLIEKGVFTSPFYSVIAVILSASMLSIVPLFFVHRYVIYPKGYLLVRVRNFLIGYWLALFIFLLFEAAKIVATHLTGETIVGKLLPFIYHLIDAHSNFVPAFVVGTAGICVFSGFLLLFLTRKDFINAIGVIFLIFGGVFTVLAVLLFKYGCTPQNAKWLVYYLTQFLLSAFSDKEEVLTVLLPMATYFYFRKKISDLNRKMYGMPYS